MLNFRKIRVIFAAEKTIFMKNKKNTGDFGPVFTQFDGKPKDAIIHLAVKSIQTNVKIVIFSITAISHANS